MSEVRPASTGEPTASRTCAARSGVSAGPTTQAQPRTRPAPPGKAWSRPRRRGSGRSIRRRGTRRDPPGPPVRRARRPHNGGAGRPPGARGRGAGPRAGQPRNPHCTRINSPAARVGSGCSVSQSARASRGRSSSGCSRTASSRARSGGIHGCLAGIGGAWAMCIIPGEGAVGCTQWSTPTSPGPNRCRNSSMTPPLSFGRYGRRSSRRLASAEEAQGGRAAVSVKTLPARSRMRSPLRPGRETSAYITPSSARTTPAPVPPAHPGSARTPAPAPGRPSRLEFRDRRRRRLANGERRNSLNASRLMPPSGVPHRIDAGRLQPQARQAGQPGPRSEGVQRGVAHRLPVDRLSDSSAFR